MSECRDLGPHNRAPSAASVSRKAGKRTKALKVYTEIKLRSWPHDHANGKCLWCQILSTTRRSLGPKAQDFLVKTMIKASRDYAEAQRTRLMLRNALRKADETKRLGS